MPKLDLSENQYCPSTGKRRFTTEEDATRRSRVAERGDPKRRPRRVYRCDDCNDWHMTTYTEYKPRVDDGTQTPEQPAWLQGWRDAARGKIVTAQRLRPKKVIPGD